MRLASPRYNSNVSLPTARLEGSHNLLNEKRASTAVRELKYWIKHGRLESIGQEHLSEIETVAVGLVKSHNANHVLVGLEALGLVAQSSSGSIAARALRRQRLARSIRDALDFADQRLGSGEKGGGEYGGTTVSSKSVIQVAAKIAGGIIRACMEAGQVSTMEEMFVEPCLAALGDTKALSTAQHYGAVLVMLQLSNEAPRILYDRRKYVLQQIWVQILKDSSQLVRKTAADALGALLQVVYSREGSKKAYLFALQQCETGLKGGTSGDIAGKALTCSLHGSLLILKQLLTHPGPWINPKRKRGKWGGSRRVHGEGKLSSIEEKLRSFCPLVLALRDHPQSFFRRAVMDIVPLLAPHSVDADPSSSFSGRRSSVSPTPLGGCLSSDLSNGFLERATWFLIHSASGGGDKDDKHRVTAYMSLADLGDTIGEALWSKPSLWSAILRIIREGIPTKGELPSEGVLACMEMAVRVTASQCQAFEVNEALVGVSTSTAFENDLRGLVMLLVSHVELNEALVKTITKVMKAFPALSSGLREELMMQLSRVLCPLDENEEGRESPSLSCDVGSNPVSATSFPPTPPPGAGSSPMLHTDSIAEGSSNKSSSNRSSWLHGIISPYSSPLTPNDKSAIKALPDSKTSSGKFKEETIVLALGVLGSFDFYSYSAEEIAVEHEVSSLEAVPLMDRPSQTTPTDHPRITTPRMFYLGFDLLHATCTNILHAEDKHYSPSVRIAWCNAACKLLQRYLAFTGKGSGCMCKAYTQREGLSIPCRSLYERAGSSGEEKDTATDITENPNHLQKSSEIDSKRYSPPSRLGDPTTSTKASVFNNFHGTHNWQEDQGSLLPTELQHAWHVLGCDRVLQTVLVLGASDNDQTVRHAAFEGLKHAWRVDPFLVAPGFSSIEFRDQTLRCLSAALTAPSAETRRSAITVVARCASLSYSSHAIYVLLKREISAITQLLDLGCWDSQALQELALQLTDVLRTAGKLLAPIMPSILQPLSIELQQYCLWPSPSSITQPSSPPRVNFPHSSKILAVKSPRNRKSLKTIDEVLDGSGRLSLSTRSLSHNVNMSMVGRGSFPWRTPPSVSVIATIYEAIGWAARICPGNVGLLMRDFLLPSLTKSLLEAPTSTLQGQQAVMRELGTICSSTGAQWGAVVSPYFHQCGLLHSMLLTLKRVDIASLELRLETLRTIGVLGALDPQVASLLLDGDEKSAQLPSRVLYHHLCYFLEATQAHMYSGRPTSQVVPLKERWVSDIWWYTEAVQDEVVEEGWGREESPCSGNEKPGPLCDGGIFSHLMEVTGDHQGSIGGDQWKANRYGSSSDGTSIVVDAVVGGLFSILDDPELRAHHEYAVTTTIAVTNHLANDPTKENSLHTQHLFRYLVSAVQRELGSEKDVLNAHMPGVKSFIECLYESIAHLLSSPLLVLTSEDVSLLVSMFHQQWSKTNSISSCLVVVDALIVSLSTDMVCQILPDLVPLLLKTLTHERSIPTIGGRGTGSKTNTAATSPQRSSPFIRVGQGDEGIRSSLQGISSESDPSKKSEDPACDVIRSLAGLKQAMLLAGKSYISLVVDTFLTVLKEDGTAGLIKMSDDSREAVNQATSSRIDYPTPTPPSTAKISSSPYATPFFPCCRLQLCIFGLLHLSEKEGISKTDSCTLGLSERNNAIYQELFPVSLHKIVCGVIQLLDDIHFPMLPPPGIPLPHQPVNMSVFNGDLQNQSGGGAAGHLQNEITAPHLSGLEEVWTLTSLAITALSTFALRMGSDYVTYMRRVELIMYEGIRKPSAARDTYMNVVSHLLECDNGTGCIHTAFGECTLDLLEPTMPGMLELFKSRGTKKASLTEMLTKTSTSVVSFSVWKKTLGILPAVGGGEYDAAVEDPITPQTSVVVDEAKSAIVLYFEESKECSKEGDWIEWMRGLGVMLLRNSPSPILQLCAPLAESHPPLAEHLLCVSFLLVWTWLGKVGTSFRWNGGGSQSTKSGTGTAAGGQWKNAFNELNTVITSAETKSILDSLEAALKSPSLPPAVSSQLLDVFEFMELKDETLPLSLSLLTYRAAKANALAKLLYYREKQFMRATALPHDINVPLISFHVESLINVYHSLGLHSNAAGILRYTNSIVSDLTVQPEWVEHMGNIDEALNLYHLEQLRVEDSMHQREKTSPSPPHNMAGGASSRHVELSWPSMFLSEEEDLGGLGTQQHFDNSEYGSPISPCWSNSVHSCREEYMQGLERRWYESMLGQLRCLYWLGEYEDVAEMAMELWRKLKRLRQDIIPMEYDNGEEERENRVSIRGAEGLSMATAALRSAYGSYSCLSTLMTSTSPPSSCSASLNFSGGRSSKRGFHQPNMGGTTKMPCEPSSLLLEAASLKLEHQMRLTGETVTGETDSIAGFASQMVCGESYLNWLEQVECFGSKAALSLRRWEDIEAYTRSAYSRKGRHAHQQMLDPETVDIQGLFMAIVDARKGDLDAARNRIHEARSSLVAPMASMLRESYGRAYTCMVSAQSLSELEEVLDCAALNAKDSFHTHNKHNQYQSVFESIHPSSICELLNTWDTRLRCMPSDPKIWRRALFVRSLVASPMEDLDVWLRLADLCRKSGYLQLCANTLRQLGAEISGGGGIDQSPVELDDDKLCTCPRLSYCVCKYLWAKGDHRSAISRIARLCSHLENEATLSSEPTSRDLLLELLIKHCEWRMADWETRRAMGEEVHEHRLESSVLKDLRKATELDPGSYRAWHAWAMLNLNLIGTEDMLFEMNASMIQEDASNRLIGGDVMSTSTSSTFSSNHQYDGNIFRAWSSASALSPVNCCHAAIAVQAFFRCLLLGGKITTVQDTLRLLTLWFQYGEDPRVDTEMALGIRGSPTEAWLAVVPQLLARVCSPSPRVRALLLQLLNRIGSDHPQALIYPITVAVSRPGPQYLAQEVLVHLKSGNCKLVNEAALISQELSKVALSLEEKWQQGLESASRAYMTKGDINTMMKKLKALHALPSSSEVDAPFRSLFGRDLNEAEEWLERFDQSQKERDLLQAWNLYHTVHHHLLNILSNRPHLHLARIAPTLLTPEMMDMELAVPGTYNPKLPGRHLIRISHFSAEVGVVWWSKQRPRKITLIGSDGKTYAFLLKGREDPQQDERAMQVVDLMNSLLAQIPTAAREGGGSMSRLHMRRFKVIPLSALTGLFGWVPHSDTLFYLIKNHREKRETNIHTEQQSLNHSAPDYDLMPLLGKIEEFKRALNTTKGDDLARVLWLMSANSESWLSRRMTFTRSVAVSSIAGYIIGLGDRHPSNIMMDRVTGQVFHIDFGDCFEVACRRDRYPETVPFRLTRMLANAMGASRTEGLYRDVCEQTMEAFRANRDSLTAMLESWVLDLISWLPQPLLGGTVKTMSPEHCRVLRGESEAYSSLETVGTPPEPIKVVGLHSSSRAVSDLQPLCSTSSLLTKSKNDANFQVNNGESLQNCSISPDRKECGGAPLKSIDSEPGTTTPNPDNEGYSASFVLKRVEQKLTGSDFVGSGTQKATTGSIFDGSGSEPHSVESQITNLILEASNLENICQLYNGWLPFW